MHNLISGLAIFFGTPLFYDIPEYLGIVSTHTFWQSISLGHFPIHPVFMAILWGFIKFIPVNAIAMIFGAASIFIFSKISKKAAILYTLLPVIWIINTNLMIEPVLLFFYILSVYLLLDGKKIWFLITVFLMVCIHLEAIFWLPTIFLIPIILNKKVKNIEFIKMAIIGIISSILFYLLIYKVSGRSFAGSTEQAMTYFSSGILRMLRNIWLTFSTGFGSLTLFILSFLIIKKADKKEKIAWLIFGLMFVMIAANWQGDLMARRAAFAGVMISLALAKYLNKKWWIFTLYLIPITLSNILLYVKPSPFVKPIIPDGQVLIETHYLKPFTTYNGTILWIGESDLNKIDNYLSSGRRVFLSENAITAPYRLLVGQNYHITSLAKIGDSESRFLFRKYKVKKFENTYELTKYDGVASALAGEPEIFYGTDFWSRLSRRRINYGDLGVWLWALATGHRDPEGWIYKDATGAWVRPEIGI